MRNIFPRDEVGRLFDDDLRFEEYTIDEVERIKEEKPNVLFGAALRVLNRVVQFNLCPDRPSIPAGCLERKDPDMYSKLSRILGAPVLRDIYYVKGNISVAAENEVKVSELLVAHVYPNNLFLADIEFVIPVRRPSGRSRGEMVRGQTAFFCKVAENAIAYGREKGCNYLMLHAKSYSHVEICGRCGFLLEDHATERQSIKLGLGIPMVRQL